MRYKSVTKAKNIKKEKPKSNVKFNLGFTCERAVKRCVKVGENSKKVCDFALLTARQIGIGLLLFSVFLIVTLYNVSQYICFKILENKWFNH